MTRIWRAIFRLDSEPVDRLAAALIENDSKLKISKDGVVSVDMENPAVRQDIRQLIQDFKDIPVERGARG
jgi:DNA-binding transcriptional regulator WhiA